MTPDRATCAERCFSAAEVIQIANETSDSFGNLYRLDFIDRIRSERGAPPDGGCGGCGNWPDECACPAEESA